VHVPGSDVPTFTTRVAVALEKSIVDPARFVIPLVRVCAEHKAAARHTTASSRKTMSCLPEDLPDSDCAGEVHPARYTNASAAWGRADGDT
jgi:hypothetical protein